MADIAHDSVGVSGWSGFLKDKYNRSIYLEATTWERLAAFSEALLDLVAKWYEGAT